MLSILTCYKKEIFWYFKQTGAGIDGADYYSIYRPIVVYCDANGNALEELLLSYKSGTRICHPKPPQYSSEQGDNFNHKIEWDSYHDELPFDYYPRGRIEVHNSQIKIFASPMIVDSEEYRKTVCRAFKYRPDRKDITWIVDRTYYGYVSEEWKGRNDLIDLGEFRWWLDDEYL